jgi:ABC-2 type transport system permease protein
MIWSTMRTAFQEAWTNRGSFWFQVTIMIVNDLAFVSFWFLLLAEVGEIRGWDVDQIMLLFAILATVTGISMGLLANTRFLGDLIADGALDAVLPLPVDPLAYLVVRRIDTALLGDLLFGPALFVIFGDPTIETTAVFLLASLCGAAVFTSFLVVLNSLTFFGVGRGEPAEIGFQSILILSSYPIEIFGGLTKLLVFTAVPAAFVTGLPTDLVGRFEWDRAALLAAVAGLSVVAARAAFNAGLRRYRSGAAWTRA